MRRLPIAGAALVALAALLGLITPAASAAEVAQGDTASVDVIEVSGLLDPVLVDFVAEAVTEGARSGSTAVVLQLDSDGAVVSDGELADLALRIAEADVQVGIWVGPSGSSAHGGSAQLLGVADVVGVAPGSRVGRTGELVLAEEEYRDDFLAVADRLEDGTIGADDAQQVGLTAAPAPIVGEFILALDGVESRVVGEGEERRREPLTTVRFGQLSLGSQLLHTVASPEVAYLLLAAGMALILFELFTAGVGVAGVVGAGAFVLGCYGMAVLPTSPVGLALLVGSMVAFAVDIQTGVPRVWTGIGLTAFVLGSFLLYDGVSMSWVTLLAGIVGVSLAMLAGMPAMVRTRFSTPTIGREWMIGEEGEAVATIDPDGVVRIREALWRARTNRATPVEPGEAVRVVGIEGLLLEVEPAEGGARDHRQRRDDGAAEAAERGKSVPST
ncbi:hypothetical protein BH24ACT3_BH24ACT3_16600 [soil metagenome]